MFHISRWKRLKIASKIASKVVSKSASKFVSNISLSALALSVTLVVSAPADAKTITAVMHSDLRVIDPGITTAYITRDHGYMVYDTLLAEDSNFKIRPQMAD